MSVIEREILASMLESSEEALTVKERYLERKLRNLLLNCKDEKESGSVWKNL